MQPLKRRTFVFITGIPDFLLKPIQSANLRETRDPRYERLRLLLGDHTAGLMAVMHLETRGYALALYASEEEAVAACQTTIVPESAERDYPPLTLRVIQKEKPLPPEAVYNPTMIIEGEEVAKDDLADTRGLELVYRGRRIAKWCDCTRDGRDCSYGVACNRIHRKSCQRTVRKRPRTHEDDASASKLSSAEEQLVQSVVLNKQAAQNYLTPPSFSSTASSPLLTLPTVYVPVTLDELEQSLNATAATPSASSSAASSAALVQRIEEALAKYTEIDTAHWPADWATKGPFFVKLSCPGGAPYDWALYDDGEEDKTHTHDSNSSNSGESESGLAQLRRLCPYPVNGIATPLQRDLMEQKLFYSLNQLNRFSTVAQGMHALRCARKARLGNALADFRAAQDSQPHRRAAKTEAETEGTAASEASDIAAVSGAAKELPLFICVQPWLYLPTAGCEAAAFTEQCGRHLRGVVQRHGALRLMTSAALLQTPTASSSSSSSQPPLEVHNALAQLDRFAIPENEIDVEAERLMSAELAQFSPAFLRAVSEWDRRLTTACAASASSSADSTSSSSLLLPAESAWCGRFAVVLSSSPAVTCRGVVMLSVTDYQRALEECVLFAHLRPSADAVAAGGAPPSASPAPATGDVSWNTQKHPFIPLFSIEQLGRLRTPAKASET